MLVDVCFVVTWLTCLLCDLGWCGVWGGQDVMFHTLSCVYSFIYGMIVLQVDRMLE